MSSVDGRKNFTLRIYPGDLAEGTIYCPISARKTTTAAEAIDRVIQRLQLDRTRCYVLAEVKEFGGEEWILNPTDCPVQRMMLWPRVALEHRPMYGGEDYRFLLRQKNLDGSIHYGGSLQMWLQVTEERRRLMERGLLPQPDSQGDHADLCCLPELNERSLLDNLRSRFYQEKIYTYVGSILIGINPFKFLPIYNPKFVKMYDNHTLGDLEPHIYAVADVAYHAMLERQRNQCIVISGESGSGKTQSTNFLIHHLTALSQKGFASGVEQIILGAGPVLEAFGNAKTAQNNNSSRFGKFIQVNYQESGTVRGAYVEKYLLEKSRLVYQEHNERNYHVFYYLLAGVGDEERKAFHLKKPEEYHYLSQMTKTPRHQHWDSYYDGEPDCFTVEGEDLKHDFERLQLAMEMVGFLPATRKLIFSLLSAILHLGNIRYKRKNRDDSIDICNPEVLPVVSELLEVKEEMLFEALTTRKTVTVGERLIVPYKLSEAGTVRDSMAKSLYSALFDWIVFRINHALLNNRDLEETTKILSIGVLDIFGFEDYESNSFEQFCINFANERLQHYFNQHIFKLEQEEYAAEGISWKNIDYIDNTGCINLISKKPTALFHLLDEECNFPQATNQTLLDKFRRQHEGNRYIEFSAVMEPAFIIQHYAGKVKYGVKDFREKNTDHMRPDIVALLKSSKNAFICSLIGIDPSATFRWAVLRAYFRALVAFKEAGKRHKPRMTGHDDSAPSAALKCLDSFSFLQHPVHQRSLEILQRCKEEKSETSHPFLTSDLAEKHISVQKNEKCFAVTFKTNFILFHVFLFLRRNKNYKSKPNLPKHLLNVKSLKYLSKLTLHDRITKSLLHLHKKKKPPSISAQFQASLNKLMETLGLSEPYFVKCIRSNADKVLCRNPIFIERYLESIMNFSKHRLLSMLKDFVHHFHVLLPPGVSVARESIQECLGQLDLQPEGYQVGKTKVFLREAQRQQLQASLHREVLRRIVVLQRRFRARLERKQFVRMREAASCIQKWWRSHRPVEQEDYGDPVLQEGAALCLQTHWRGYRARQRFRRWRQAALVLQKLWRFQLERRCAAALVIQAAWRCHGARREYQDLREAVGKLQALSRGFLARRRFRELREQKLKQEEKLLELQNGLVNVPLEEWEQPDTTMGLDLSTWEDRTCEERERSLLNTNRDEEKRDSTEAGSSNARTDELPLAPTPPTIHREKDRTLDEGSHKTTRAKRENRRMRELEQAQFSLKLLKVRANSSGVSSSPEEQRCSVELVPPASPSLPSPQGTPDSQSSKGSFELLVMDEDPSKALEMAADREEPGSPLPAVPDESESNNEVFVTTSKNPAETLKTDVSEAVSLQENHSPTKMDLPPHPAKTESCLPTFYIPAREHSPAIPLPAAESQGNSAPQVPAPKQEQVIMDKLLKLNEEREERQRSQQQQNEREMMEQIRQQKGVLERQRLSFVQHEREMFEKRREEVLQRIQRSQEAEQSSASSSTFSSSSLQGERSPQITSHGRTHSDSSPSSPCADPHVSARLPQLPPPPASAPTERRRDRRPENLSCSPDLTLDRGFRDLKENKEPSPKVKRRRSVKISSVALEPIRWQNEALQILTCTNDYRSMNDFLMKKVHDLDTEDSKKDTMVDVVFKKALKEFRLNIFNSYSTALAMDDGKSIRYKDLYALFEHILEKTMRQEQRDWRESPVKVWVNTFKIFLDEFMTEYKPLDSKVTVSPKPERKKRRKKDADTVEEHNGHIFKSTQYSIPTFCEYCSSLIWMMDRASVCKLCRYACHRKCCQKTTVKCSKMFDPELSSRQFGVDISHLTNEEKTVPLVVEKLINYIEMHGIYTEGIYRKPGSANKIKELRLGLDNDVDGINLDDYNIHVIASVFKQWLRDLPNPLMTFELYEEFVRAMGSQDKKEIIRGVYSIIDQLSRTHLNTLERLIFHLVRIALQEDTNRMSANALAIVFAPCILRCPDTIDPLQSVQDISKTTACVEYIICEQMNKYKVRLKDISTLEFAESKAKNKLTLIRRSMGKGRVPGLSYHAPSPPLSPRLQPASEPAREESGGEESAEATIISEHQQVAMQHEERVLAEQIEHLQKEKEELTFEMLSLEPRASDDETLDSEASIGTGDSSENLNVDSEETISDFSGRTLTSPWPRRSDGRSHRGHAHRRQLDCQEAAESCSTVSSFSTLSHFHPSSSSSAASRRFRFHTKSATLGSGPAHASQTSRFDSFDSSPPREPEVDEKPQFTSRGTYNPEKGKQKLRGARHSVTRHSRQGPGRDPSTDVPQHMVLYGSNEFMV
uniref:Myosin IXA n=1 Tax=Oryzias sinensis TaxID=183150 RepID=A0A8C8E2L2_9TELE